jgi:hypothetical protein
LSLFRRRETPNEQLLREAGLSAGSTAAPAAQPPATAADEAAELPDGPVPWFPTGMRETMRLGAGLALPGLYGGGPYLPRADDAVVTLAADVRGGAIQFVTLPDGSLLVEEQEGDEDLSPFAAAVEAELPPPYRARARRQEGTLWAVGVARLDVRELPGLPGDAITVTRRGDVEETLVDGAPHSPLPRLAALADDVEFALQAERLDGDWWELQVSAL